MYAVIEFGGEDANKTAVVRKEWLTPQKGEVFWPPFKLSSQFNKALLEGASPDESNWALYNVKRCLYFCDDLLKARQKERETEIESDLVTTEQEEFNENIRKKRRTNKPWQFISSDEEDTARSTCKKILKYPDLPKSCTTTSSQKENNISCSPPFWPKTIEKRVQYPKSSSATSHSEENDISCSPPFWPTTIEKRVEYPKHPKSSSTTASSNENNKSCSTPFRPTIISTENNSITSFENCFASPARLQSPQTTGNSASPSEISQALQDSGFSIVAKKLAALEHEVASMKQILEEYLPRLPIRNEIEVHRENMPPLPCQSKEDATKLEEWIAIDNNEQLLVQYLSRVGGRTVDYVIKKILERLFTNTLAQLYNWTGKHSKQPLKGSKIIDVIYSVVRKNKGTNSATDFEMEKTVRSWFRFAKDREGGREKRRKNNSV